MPDAADSDHSETGRRTRRPGGRTQDVSQRIFAATADVLIARGYGALTFNEIADQAGVSRSTLYRRWPTKAELVLDVASTLLAERVKAPDTGSLHEDAAAALMQTGALLASPFGGALIAAYIELERAAEGREWRQELFVRRLTDLWPMFERAKARGEIAADFDAEAAIAAAAGAMYFRVIMMARTVDRAWVERVLAMVGPQPESAS